MRLERVLLFTTVGQLKLNFIHSVVIINYNTFEYLNMYVWAMCMKSDKLTVSHQTDVNDIRGHEYVG